MTSNDNLRIGSVRGREDEPYEISEISFFRSFMAERFFAMVTQWRTWNIFKGGGKGRSVTFFGYSRFKTRSTSKKVLQKRFLGWGWKACKSIAPYIRGN